MTDSTVAAIATPPGKGGIAVVRISGPQAYRVNRVSGPVPRRRKSVRARFLEAANRAGPRRAVCREVLCQVI